MALVDEKTLEDIGGFDSLSGDEARLLREGRSAEPSPRGPQQLDEATPAHVKTVGKDGEGGAAQPPKGTVLRAKGRVCWRFAGHLCFGALLPAQETKTHCYARTHKGNTKILTKGGSSWWLLEE